MQLVVLPGAADRLNVIVSIDLTAELNGSRGLGGSLNVDRDDMAQAAHGSAPDIAGQDVAGPASPGSFS